jgi:tetratricopeptide (TPR) repeat protein
VATQPTTQTQPQKPPATTQGKKLIVTEIPKTFDEQMDLAQRLVEREQFDEAQRLFETILGYAAHVPAVHVGLGKCALEQGRTTEAIQHYQNALARLSTYGPAIFGLAKAYRQKGDKEQAISWYRKYLEINPTGSAAAVARDAIAKLEGQPAPAPPPSSELVKPSSAPQGNSSELIKPQ